MDAAFLVGISRYRDHQLRGVPNDLELLARALDRHGYSPADVHVLDDSKEARPDDSHTTRSGLERLFRQIGQAYDGVEQGSCYLHIGASGALSLAPLAGGILPSDGDLADFATAFPFAELNSYLPIRPGIRVVVTLDT